MDPLTLLVVAIIIAYVVVKMNRSHNAAVAEIVEEEAESLREELRDLREELEDAKNETADCDGLPLEEER